MMLVLERPETAAAVKAPVQHPEQVKPPAAPVQVPEIIRPALAQPEVHIGMARGATPEWKGTHGRTMQRVEGAIALGLMVYFGAGLLAVFDIL